MHVRSMIGIGMAALALMWMPAVARAQGQSPTYPGGTPRPGGIGFDRLNMQNAGSAGTDATQGGGGVAEEAGGAGVAPESAAGGGGTGDGGGGGTAVQAIRGDRAVGVKGAQGFEPTLSNKVVYQELPDVTETLSYPNIGQPQPLTDFLLVLADVSGWNVVVSKGIEILQVQFSVTNVTPAQAMEILRFHGVYYTYDAKTNTLYVMTTEEYLSREYGALKSEEFRVQYADVADAEEVLSAMLSPEGKLISDPRTGQFLVWDTRANIDEMRHAMEQIDVPVESRVFPLRYVQAEDLLESVEDMISERGAAQADPRTNTLVVTDLSARQDVIAKLVEALDHRMETVTWTLNYVEPETVQERLEELLPEEAAIVTSDEDTHQLSVTAPPEQLKEVEDLVKAWDVKPLQVQIEAYLVTANSDVTRNFAIDWAYFDEISGSPVAIINGSRTQRPFEAPEDGIRIAAGELPFRVALRNPITGAPIRDAEGNLILDPEWQGDTVAAAIDWLDKQGDVTILSKPRVTVRDGMEASFENTEEIPYQSYAYSAYGNNGTGNNVNNISPYVIPTTVQKETVGTILKVKPRVTELGTIDLEIEAEDSTAEIVTIVSGGRPSTVPQVRKSLAKTQVVVHNGQTIALGGLRANVIQDDVERVPVLGDIPLFGWLFKSTERKRQERDLLVFLTPTIVSGYTEREAERLASIDAAVAEKLRNSLKPLMERINTKLNGEQNQVNVAIGQSGSLYVDHQLTTLEQIEVLFQTMEEPTKKTVVIRAHPGAPAGLADRIAQLASNAGMGVEKDAKALPFVPAPAPGTVPGELVIPTEPTPGALVPTTPAPAMELPALPETPGDGPLP